MNAFQTQWDNMAETEDQKIIGILQDQIANPAKYMLESQIRMFYRHSVGGFEMAKFVAETEFTKLYGELLTDHPMYKLFSTQPLSQPCGLILIDDGKTDSIVAQTHRTKATLSLRAMVELYELHRVNACPTIVQMVLEESWMETIRHILSRLMEVATAIKYRKPHTLKKKVNKTLSDTAHTNVVSGAETACHLGPFDWSATKFGIQSVAETPQLTQFYDPLFPTEKVLSWKPQEVVFAPYCITGMLNGLEPESFDSQTVTFCSRYGIKFLDDQLGTFLITK